MSVRAVYLNTNTYVYTDPMMLYLTLDENNNIKLERMNN